MILDKLDNAQLYYPLSKNIKRAFEFIKSTEWEKLEPGKYILDDSIYANLQEYTTKNPDEAEFEVHRKYYDIQYVISGTENMGVGQLDEFEVLKPYDEENDAAFGTCRGSVITVPNGYFTMFAPKDAHKPSLNPGSNSCKVKKVIVKILI